VKRIVARAGSPLPIVNGTGAMVGLVETIRKLDLARGGVRRQTRL